MPRARPAVLQVERGDDGSVTVRSTKATWVTQAEWHRWQAQHPGSTRADIAAGRVPPPPSSGTKPTGRPVGITEPVNQLQVWPPCDGEPHPRRAQVMVCEGLTPAALQRFPWKSMLTIADAALRTSPDETLSDAGRRMNKAFRLAFPDPDKPQRPGRRGLTDEFYRSVADEYRQLRAQGVNDPTNQLAQRHGYNRSTVAGWVSTARNRGYLPPARPGRAG